MITDANADIVAINKAFTTITGYREHEVLGKNARIMKSGRHDREFYKGLWSSLTQQGAWQGEIWGRRKNGEIFPKWQTISAVLDRHAKVTHCVSVFSDITQIKKSQEQLHNLCAS